MLIDNVKIKVKAGNGGKGAVAFNKIMMAYGPTGARGGKGGSVLLEAVGDLAALRHYRAKKDFKAENGGEGRSQYRDGTNGKDLILPVPRGTVVSNLTKGERQELVNAGERLLVASGGNGGKGNFHYKSSLHTSPTKSQPGLPGEECELEFELKLIADIGLIGLPNAGKSSFINEVTNAKSKVANYPFTTLEPHLGDYFGLILADIPGLIEGASGGRGLGTKFLRHIERTRILFHFVDVNSVDPARDYKIIRKELGAFNKILLKKPECIFISKADTASQDQINKTAEILKKQVYIFSIYNPNMISAAKNVLNAIRSQNRLG